MGSITGYHTFCDVLTTVLWKGRTLVFNSHLKKWETSPCLVQSKTWPSGFHTTRAVFSTSKVKTSILRGESWRFRYCDRIWEPQYCRWQLIWKLLLGCKHLLVFWFPSTPSCYVKPTSSHEVSHYHRKPFMLTFNLLNGQCKEIYPSNYSTNVITCRNLQGLHDLAWN